MIQKTSCCPICSSNDVEVVCELKNYPLTELFVPSCGNARDRTQHPLIESDQTLKYCSDCSHAFLENVISPDYLYSKDNYNTVTTNSSGSLISIKNFARFINQQNHEVSYTIDIGGNDSNLLRLINCEVGCVIDPNASSNDKRYSAINNFFEAINPEKFNGAPVNIVSSHTLEHIQSPHTFFNFLSSIKTIEHVFLQFPCLELMHESSRYDLIHHQHLHYYTLNSIQTLAKQYGFIINAYEYDHDHYGTLRVHIAKEKVLLKQSIHEKLSSKLDINDLINDYKLFNKSCSNNSSMLTKLPSLYCYGASLMLPIIYYYYPSLSSLSKGIYDMDESKSSVRYANVQTPILHDDGKVDFNNMSICITAVATKSAHRKILTNLAKRQPIYIFNPFGAL
ncbi:methyltransferase domain-containing protein [Prochlorococcus sp. MIT 1300]|uniref:methyltransferase domain-containing protein n=1 Tax=Prochlorococcus sp. MIT 1300 TaxID=3096218 RepID=UPI002A75F327|nr:methyltransferase domain-containing protein [Prochlorococcus sp. MIT 1300]